MSTYIIGDIHGCFYTLNDLLEALAFNPNKDRIICTGDLINRGKHSFEVLNFFSKHSFTSSVLGNHDLYFLAYAFWPNDVRANGLDRLLEQPNIDLHIEWLRHQPLLMHLPQNETLIVHAGLYPLWSQEVCFQYAKLVEDILIDPINGPH